MKLALSLAMAASAGAFALAAFEIARPRAALAVHADPIAAAELVAQSLQLSLPQSASEPERRVQVAVVEPLEAPFAAAAERQAIVPQARLSGRAVDMLGRPIEWFRVEIREEGRAEPWIGGTYQSPSPDGAFDAALALEPGFDHPLWLTIEACGYDTSTTFLKLAASERREGLVVSMLQRIPEVYGRVVDRTGRPIAGARVTALSSVHGPDVATAGAFRAYTAVDPLPGRAAESVETDARGDFAMRCTLGVGVAALVVDDAFHPQALYLREDQGGDWHDVLLELDSGGAIRGTVVDEQGRPLEGLRVQACAKDPRTFTHRWLEGVSWSADEGRFEVKGLPEGEVDVCFWRKIADGYYRYWSCETVQSHEGRVVRREFRLPRWTGPEPEEAAEASSDDAREPETGSAHDR